MNLLIINCGSRAIKELKQMTTGLGANTTMLPIKSLPPASVKKYDGIIISGSPLMWSKCRKTQLAKFNWVKTCNKPVLGICFGHQAVALLYGAPIRHGSELIKKVFIRLQQPDPLTQDIKPRALFMQHHEEYVTSPKQFKVIAESSNQYPEIIKHYKKPVYGVQFHPELSGKNGEIIFKNFFQICKSK
ncbi:hypothetical protein GF391_03145 [Candidatus Uhrbacteria bacterium]|nr:hypothetical protein [Candidatus Uhrbacteria bacterium]